MIHLQNSSGKVGHVFVHVLYTSLDLHLKEGTFCRVLDIIFSYISFVKGAVLAPTGQQVSCFKPVSVPSFLMLLLHKKKHFSFYNANFTV